jgi:hypothetical protein
MGGGGDPLGLPLGATAWCTGQDVIDSLDGLFHQNPTNPQYQAAKTASLALFQKAASTGSSADLWTAYGKAYDAAGLTLCGGWSTYLTALGDLTPSSSNGGNVVTSASTPTSSAILTFDNVPGWMAVGLNVSDSTTPGGITGGQTVMSFTGTTVTLTANVNATVNSGDTIAFSLPAGQGPTNIQLIAQARVDGLSNNVKMKTNKHDPHNPNSSGHCVKVKLEQDHSITIDSPYLPPNAALRNRNRNP